MRCACAGKVNEKHSVHVDNSLHRQSRSKKKDCQVRYSLRRKADGMWHLTPHGHLYHNHSSPTSNGLPLRARPTSAMQAKAATIMADHGEPPFEIFSTLMRQAFPDFPFDSRQLSNLRQAVRVQLKADIRCAGGDLAAVYGHLKECADTDPGWHYEFDTYPDGRFRRLFFMSPEQFLLAQKFSDVIIHDNTMGRNQFNLPLGIWIGIDGNGHNRNLAYCLCDDETYESHAWALDQFLSRLPKLTAKRIIMTDHDLAVEKAIEELDDLVHLLCLYHIMSNLVKMLKSKLGARFLEFYSAWWIVYRAGSMHDVEEKFQQLMVDYPESRSYLEKELWPTRLKWAWCAVSSTFTCLIRTSGRSESENRINRHLGNTKTPVITLVKSLIDRTQKQMKKAQEKERSVRCLSVPFPHQRSAASASDLLIFSRILLVTTRIRDWIRYGAHLSSSYVSMFSQRLSISAIENWRPRVITTFRSSACLLVPRLGYVKASISQPP